MIPVIIIIIVIISLGVLIPGNVTGEQSSENYQSDLINSIVSQPFGGSKKIDISEENYTGYFSLSWGLRQGGNLLIFSGIVFIAAGVCLFASNSVFFEPKTPYERKRKKDRESLSESSKKEQTAVVGSEQNQEEQKNILQPTSDDQTSKPDSENADSQTSQATSPSVEQKKQETEPSSREKLFCANCGAMLEKDSGFCPECGAKVEKNTGSDSKTKK